MEIDHSNGKLFAGEIPEENPEIRAKLELLDLLEHASSDVIWIMDMQLRTVYMSPSVEKNLGYSIEEYIKMPLSERLPRESFELTQKIMLTEILPVVKGEKPDTGKPVVYEMLHKHKDGRLAWGEVSINFLYNNKGEITSIMGITRNINDRKVAQQALAESREQYRQLVEKSPDWIWEIDADNRFTYINAVAESVLGIPIKDLIGRSIFDFSDPETVENEKARFENLKKAGLSFSGLLQVLRDLHGRQVYLEISANPGFDKNGKLTGYRGVGRDVTDKQIALRKLERLENVKNFILELPLFALIELDDSLEIIEWGADSTHIFGYGRNRAMIDNIFLNLWEPARRKSIVATIRRKVKSRETRTVVSLNIRNDGTLIRCRWFIDSRFDKMGKFSGAVLIADDITDSFRNEHLTDGLSSLMKAAGKEVLFTDLKLNLTYVSVCLFNVPGTTCDKLIGQNARKFFDVASFKRIAEQGVSFAKKNLRWSDSVQFSVKGDGWTERKLEISGITDSNGKLSGYTFLLASEN